MSSAGNAALITYAGSWRDINSAFQSQLPLRNLHWKSANRPSVRSIQQLDLSLVPHDSIRDEFASQVPVSLLEKPLLNVYVLTCEESDAESYRTTHRKQIKEWHATVTSRKNQEWLIVQVVSPDARVPSGRMFQLKGLVSDKLKADFNSDKKDRCVQLPWTAGTQNPVAWVDLINKLKDGLLLSFDSAVTQREDEVRRSESQRVMPGWNFCNFFLLKESLASSFAGVGLFEDALLQYDELEASFFQVMKEKNLSWFGTLITPTKDDDASPLLSISKKPYRDLILANNISVFDFRIYLLARQCEVLAKLGRMNEICRRAAAFLGAFGRRLREVEDTLPPFFIVCWQYSSALSVVEQCDIWSKESDPEGQQSAMSYAGKGELLELARAQLDVLGVHCGHLPKRPPFTNLFNDSSAVETDNSSNVNNSALLGAINDKEVFYQLYTDTTNRAIEMYAKGGRRKFAVKLHGSLAAIDLHRGRLDAALSTYTSLPAHYEPHGWTSLESFMYSRALDTHSSLSKDKDRQWLDTLLAFLKTYVNSLGMEMLLFEDDRAKYISKLVDEMKTVANALESDFPYLDHPAISIIVLPEARNAEDQDGSYLSVVVENRLPCDLPVETIQVTLNGRDAERLNFSARCNSLSPGKKKIDLFCPLPSPGVYVLDTCEARLSRVVFQWVPRKATAGRSRGKSSKETRVLVRIPRDPLALDVMLRLPEKVELGGPRHAVVVLNSGRNNVTTSSIKLSLQNVDFSHRTATLSSGCPGEFSPCEDCVQLSNVPQNSSVAIRVGYSDASALQTMKVTIEVSYKTAAEPSSTRSLRLVRNIVTSLPVSLFVEDFFRDERLFSKFTISTTTTQHVRILGAELEPADARTIDGVRIRFASLPAKKVTSVTPAQPASFLFCIESAGGPVRDSLDLRITYRMLREEIELFIDDVIGEELADSPRLIERKMTLSKTIISALESENSWVSMYAQTGELHVPEKKLDEDLNVIYERIRERLKEGRSSTEGRWKEMIIPVDIPFMNIVAAASIKITPTSISSIAENSKDSLPPLHAGQPISATLCIHTSFHWGSNPSEKKRSYRMRYDVEEMVHQWLVSGRKRGDFSASHNGIFTAPITLVALHHGMLALPEISINALPVAGGETTMGSVAVPNTVAYQTHGAEKVLILPRAGRSTFIVGMGNG